MPRKRRNPKTVKPTNKSAKEYAQKIIKPLITDPIREAILSAISGDMSVLQSLDFFRDQAYINFSQLGDSTTLKKLIEFFDSLSEDHLKKMSIAFHAAIKIDIRGVLQNEPELTYALGQRIHHNIELIKSLRTRTVDSVWKDVIEVFVKEPFNREELAKYFRTALHKNGYPLRRLARDQVNKAIGQFTELRQKKIGIVYYIWRTSQDNRVRESCRGNEGEKFDWHDPPPGGHPGEKIQCRCTAEAVIDNKVVNYLRAIRGDEELKKSY